MPGSENGAQGVPGSCESNAQRPSGRHARPAGTLRWGTGCWSVVKMGRGGARVARHTQATTALSAASTPSSDAPGSPEGGRVSRRTAQPTTSPGSPRDARRRRYRYPTARWWGAGSGELGAGTPTTVLGTGAGRRGAIRDATVGKQPLRVSITRAACGVRCRSARGKKPQCQQRSVPRTRGDSQSVSRAPGLREARLFRVPAPVSGSRSTRQGSLLRP